MITNSPYVINDLPNGTYSVTWHGHEFVLVNNPGKALMLLEILFDVVGVDEAMIGVQESGRDNDWQTMHISNMLWLEDRTREHMAKRLAEYTIPGVRFTDIYQAEKFKDHLEKRLAWKRLSGGGAWS
jgi:hypothetical protein